MSEFFEDKKKNLPVSVYIPNEAREKIEKLLPKMGFENLHQYLQYSALYFLKSYQEDPGIIKTEKTIKKPEI